MTRLHQHRTGATGGFTKQHGVHRLVYFEGAETMQSAIVREKQLKAGSRLRKLALIEAGNPTSRDLYDDIL